MFRLGAGHSYQPVEASGYLKIRADGVTRWLVEEDTSDDLAWLDRLSEWLRQDWSRG